MGILNLTPDSFYDGGKLGSEKEIIYQAEKMLKEGATFLDLGGYSSRPGANFVSEADELNRVLPAVKTLIKEFTNIDVSKQFQSSDFGGELTPAQLNYCARDVIYLHKIHEELFKILQREKRVDLYKDCLKFLSTRVELDLALFNEDIWSH